MTVVARLQQAVSEHPGLVLEGPDRERFAAAVAGLDDLVRTVGLPDDALVWCAWALRKLGRFAEAHDAVDRALARERSWKALTAKASVARAEGALDGAVALYDEAASVEPRDTLALTEAAQALGEVGRFPEAAERFGRAADRDPMRVDARAWQEFALFQVDHDPARATRVRALAEAHPDDRAIGWLLGWME